MPLYQVSYKVNSRSYNTDMEAKNIDAVKKLFSELSVGHITEIKEYVYFGEVKKFDTNPDYNRSITCYCNFDDRFPIKVKIPKLKPEKDKLDIRDYLSSFYRGLKYIKFYFGESIS